MKIVALLPYYLVWHYTGALKDFFGVSKNLLWFIFNFFSIELLANTLFSPWRRLAKDETSAHASFITDLIINVLMRISGFFIRLITIIMGAICYIFSFFVLVIGFVIWLFLPFLVFILFFYGISYFLP